jgi:tungstate transport system substrate-binding protein
VMDVNPAKHPHVKQREARQFIDWLVSPEGVAAIKSLQVNGVALFTPGAPPKE